MQNSTLSNSHLAFHPSQETEIAFLARQFIEDSVRNADQVNLYISEEDEMLLYNLLSLRLPRERAILQYFEAGLRTLDTLKQVINWKIGEVSQVKSFLDFASGYGRMTRFLVQEIPPETVWIADIYQEGVKFQTEQFGVKGIISTPLPEQFDPGLKFEVISVISLFSHLPEKTFLGWLKKLYELLEDNGVLMFSTHNIDLTPSDVEMSESDSEIIFIPRSESRSLDTAEYGSTFVTENYVHKAVALATNGEGKVYRIPKGIVNYQDLYLVVKNPEPDFQSLQFFQRPLGHLDACEMSASGELVLAGWAATPNLNTKIAAIEVYINGQLQQQLVPSILRPDVAQYYQNEQYLNSGWQCTLSLAEEIDLKAAILKVTIVDSLNLDTVLYLGKIEEK